MNLSGIADSRAVNMPCISSRDSLACMKGATS